MADNQDPWAQKILQALIKSKSNKSAYRTQLTPSEEVEYQRYAKLNKAWRTNYPDSDYDERGQWKAMKQGVDPGGNWTSSPLLQLSGDGTMHGSDVWKTPFHNTLSNESKYAPPGAPAWNDKSQLQTQGSLANPLSPTLRNGVSTIMDEGQFSKNLAVQQLLKALGAK